MPSFSRDTFLQIVANEKMGFSFGLPERIGEESLSVVLPILRETSIERQYVTLPEVQDQVEMSDTGSIEGMQVKNKTGKNLFIRSGTIFKGGTQERALMRSAVIFPEGKTVVKVRCVHRSKGINTGAKVGYGALTSLDFDQLNYEKSFSPKDQSQYWSNVEKVSGRLARMANVVHAADEGFSSIRHSHRPRSRSGLRSTSASRGFMGSAGIISTDTVYTDDYSSNLDHFARTFDEVLRKVKLHENQAGLALITDKGCETIEFFDLPISWKALHEDAIKRLGPNLVNKDMANVFEYKPERARELVHQVLMKGYKQDVIYDHRPSNGEPAVTVIGLSTDGFTGEVVEIDGRVMHLSLFRLATS